MESVMFNGGVVVLAGALDAVEPPVVDSRDLYEGAGGDFQGTYLRCLLAQLSGVLFELRRMFTLLSGILLELRYLLLLLRCLFLELRFLLLEFRCMSLHFFHELFMKIRGIGLALQDELNQFVSLFRCHTSSV